MPRYIDIDALKKDIRENYVVYGYEDFISDFFRCLDEQPTVDAERHGRWVNHLCEDGATDGIYCSQCDYEIDRDARYKYCPNCGAKMDLSQGEREEDAKID